MKPACKIGWLFTGSPLRHSCYVKSRPLPLPKQLQYYKWAEHDAFVEVLIKETKAYKIDAVLSVKASPDTTAA